MCAPDQCGDPYGGGASGWYVSDFSFGWDSW